jgi:hypothetical protein
LCLHGQCAGAASWAWLLSSPAGLPSLSSVRACLSLPLPCVTCNSSKPHHHTHASHPHTPSFTPSSVLCRVRCAGPSSFLPSRLRLRHPHRITPHDPDTPTHHPSLPPSLPPSLHLHHQQDNAVTRSVPSFGRSSPMSMGLTPPGELGRGGEGREGERGDRCVTGCCEK